MKLYRGRPLPSQSIQEQALETAAQAAWRTGKDQVPQLGPVVPHESLVWMKMQEEAVGGEPVEAHPPLPHVPLLAHHLERNTQVLVIRTS